MSTAELEDYSRRIITLRGLIGDPGLSRKRGYSLENNKLAREIRDVRNYLSKGIA